MVRRDAGVLALTLALAATNLAPALVLSPSIESRTMVPGTLILADEPGDGRPLAAALASVAIALNVLALRWPEATGTCRSPPGAGPRTQSL